MDASLFSAAAILQQYQENGTVLRVLGYASRPFATTERAYCVTRREMTAIIFGSKQFRPYILGRQILFRTDHAALTYIRSTAEPIPQLAHYLDFIAAFDFDIVFRRGISHVNADYVSRLRPCEGDTGDACRQCNKPSTSRKTTSAIAGYSNGINRVTTRAHKQQKQSSHSTNDVVSGNQPTSLEDSGDDRVGISEPLVVCAGTPADRLLKGSNVDVAGN